MTRAIFPLLLVTTLFHASDAHAAIVTLEPTIDGTQRRTGFPFPTFTYFTGDAFVRASFSQTTNHANVSVEENYFAMEFDLSSIPAGLIVTSASLSWTELSDFLSQGNIHPLKGYVGDGLFTVSDFAGGADLGQVASGTNDGRVSFDVTAFAAARVAASNRFAGFSVLNGGYYQQSIGMFGTYTTVGEYRIGSRLASPDSRPRLVLVFVPEIDSFSIASAAAIGLLAIRHFRSRPGKGRPFWPLACVICGVGMEVAGRHLARSVYRRRMLLQRRTRGTGHAVPCELSVWTDRALPIPVIDR